MDATGSSTSACSDEDPTGEAAEIELCPISGDVAWQCTPCYESLRQEIEDAKYVFDNQHIYVKMQADEQSTSKSGGEKEEKEGKEKEKDKKGSKEGSKAASEEGPDVIPLEIVTLPSSSSNGGNGEGGRVGPRSRRGASKGLIKVRMNSHQTVKDLKIALLKHVHYSPVDQLLYSTVGGQLLDDELTLMEAKILPENYDTPIILIVQSGSEAGLNSPTNEKNRAIERGFYDTALAH